MTRPTSGRTSTIQNPTMKTQFSTFLAAGAFAFGLCTAFSGCASLPVRQATTEFSPTAYASMTGLTPPAPLRTVDPLFPYDMKRAGISGLVRVACTIDEAGH